MIKDAHRTLVPCHYLSMSWKRIRENNDNNNRLVSQAFDFLVLATKEDWFRGATRWTRYRQPTCLFNLGCWRSSNSRVIPALCLSVPIARTAMSGRNSNISFRVCSRLSNFCVSVLKQKQIESRRMVIIILVPLSMPRPAARPVAHQIKKGWKRGRITGKESVNTCDLSKLFIVWRLPWVKGRFRLHQHETGYFWYRIFCSPDSCARGPQPLETAKIRPADSLVSCGKEGQNLSGLKNIWILVDAFTLVSLRNKTAERRGRQNACACQTWQGYYLRVSSWSSPKGLVKKDRGGGGGGPEHLEMWLIKKTWPTPSLRHKNDWPTPKARLEIAWPTP